MDLTNREKASKFLATSSLLVGDVKHKCRVRMKSGCGELGFCEYERWKK